jgi:hypothetical protein
MAGTSLLRPPRNISFEVLGIKARWWCAACGRVGAGDGLRCERCTQVTHWSCYWDRVAEAAEVRQRLHAETAQADDDTEEAARLIEGLVILCLGCRS